MQVRGERFLKGPIPWAWLVRAGQLPGKALHVAVALWHHAGMSGSLKVKRSMSSLGKEFGFDRATATRALQVLEEANLVHVVRKDGNAPVVTLLKIPKIEEAPGRSAASPKSG